MKTKDTICCKTFNVKRDFTIVLDHNVSNLYSL